MQQSRVRSVRHESALGRWEMIRSDPHPGLRAHVSDYCGYVEQTAAPLRRRELPTGEVVLVFSFGDPLRLLDSGDPAAPGTLLTSFVSGPYQSYALTETLGLQHGVQVTLTALGAYMLFGRFLVKRHRKERTAYAVTNQRALIALGSNALQEAPMRNIPRTVRRHRDGRRVVGAR